MRPVFINLAIVLFLLAIGIFAYLYSQNQQLKKELAISQKEREDFIRKRDNFD